MRFSYEQEVIFTTLLYSDIFNFPLTEDELWQYLLSKKRINKKDFLSALNSLSSSQKVITNQDGYFCLVGREQIITRRKKYLTEVAAKLLLANKAALALSSIPTIQFIGISGGLAVGNVSEKDDIDFFIITQKNTLFTTRLWILLLLEVQGLRRTWKTQNAANKICVNLLVDETHLAWSSEQRDLYIAHEIAQLRPLFERSGIYHTFIQANSWITQFLPNWKLITVPILTRNGDVSPLVKAFLFNSFVEKSVRFLQEYYMRRHQTTEKVEKRFLAFHPKDYRVKALSQLRSKRKQVGLLTKV